MKLYYFDIYGRAEPFRFLLWHAKVEYEDIRIKGEEWPKLRAENPEKFEFGQLPMFEENGVFISQSNSIMRYLGKRFGYYPIDAMESWQADSIVDSIADFLANLIKSMSEPDPTKKKELEVKIFTEHLPKWLGVLEKRL